jgi:hypothetical protein
MKFKGSGENSTPTAKGGVAGGTHRTGTTAKPPLARHGEGKMGITRPLKTSRDENSARIFSSGCFDPLRMRHYVRPTSAESRCCDAKTNELSAANATERRVCCVPTQPDSSRAVNADWRRRSRPSAKWAAHRALGFGVAGCVRCIGIVAELPNNQRFPQHQACFAAGRAAPARAHPAAFASLLYPTSAENLKGTGNPRCRLGSRLFRRTGAEGGEGT